MNKNIDLNKKVAVRFFVNGLAVDLTGRTYKKGTNIIHIPYYTMYKTEVDQLINDNHLIGLKYKEV